MSVVTRTVQTHAIQEHEVQEPENSLKNAINYGHPSVKQYTSTLNFGDSYSEIVWTPADLYEQDKQAFKYSDRGGKFYFSDLNDFKYIYVFPEYGNSKIVMKIGEYNISLITEKEEHISHGGFDITLSKSECVSFLEIYTENFGGIPDLPKKNRTQGGNYSVKLALLLNDLLPIVKTIKGDFTIKFDAAMDHLFAANIKWGGTPPPELPEFNRFHQR